MSSTSSEYSISDAMAAKIVQFLDKELQKSRRRAVPMPEIYASFKPELGDLEQYRFTGALSKAAKGGKFGKYDVLRGPGGGLGVPKKNPLTAQSVKIQDPKVQDPKVQSSKVPPSPKTDEPTFVQVNEEKPVVKVVEPKAQALSVQKMLLADLPSVESQALVPPPVVPTVPLTAKRTEMLPPPIKSEPLSLFLGESEYRIPEPEGTITTVLVNVFECKEDPEGEIVFGQKRFKCDEHALHYLTNFVFYSMRGSFTLRSESHFKKESKDNVLYFPERKAHGNPAP